MSILCQEEKKIDVMCARDSGSCRSPTKINTFKMNCSFIFFARKNNWIYCARFITHSTHEIHSVFSCRSITLLGLFVFRFRLATKKKWNFACYYYCVEEKKKRELIFRILLTNFTQANIYTHKNSLFFAFLFF